MNSSTNTIIEKKPKKNQSIQITIPIQSNKLNAIKSMLVSIPEFHEVFKGSFEQLFGAKTSCQLMPIFLRSVWRYFRNPMVSKEKKFKVFRNIHFPRLFLVSNSIGSLQEFVETVIVDSNKREFLNSKESFELFYHWLVYFDENHKTSIEDLLNPLVFPKQYNIREQLKSKLKAATSDELKKIVKYFKSVQWDYSFSISELTHQQVIDLLMLFD